MTLASSGKESGVVLRTWRDMPVCDRGEGIYLFDREGKRYIDGAAGSSVVVNIGHGVKEVADAMYRQAQKVSFAAPHVFANEPLMALGRLVAEHAPGTMRNNCRTWFTCTGTDAVDDAMRLTRQHFVAVGKRSKQLIIGRWQGFHGNNLAVSGIHGHTGRRRIYMPMFINSPHIPPAYCYRCYFEKTYPDCGLKCARALETEIRQQGDENVAAFIAEPVVGAALGAVPAPDGYFQIIREICSQYNVMMVTDEVMTAWGRTGHWFAIEGWGVTPDIIATAKGMTSGYTALAATIAREEVWEPIQKSGAPFLAGHTMDLNPVSCAGARVAIEYVEQHQLLENVRQVGAYLQERLRELREYKMVGDVRGKGLMCGIEFVRDQETRLPFDPSLKVSLRFQDEAMRRGLVLFHCTGCVDGVAGDMILVTPPLVITRPQVDEMMAILLQTTAAVEKEIL